MKRALLKLYNRPISLLKKTFMKDFLNKSSRTFSMQTTSDQYVNYSKRDFELIQENIKKELTNENKDLQQASQHHFDGCGKYIRPTICLLMAQACNSDHKVVKESQREVATIVEMIHTASLLHDDVIDASDSRRGAKTAQCIWGQKKAVLAGNYILATASVKLSRLNNTLVTNILSQVLHDLVTGEFMQLGCKEKSTERFQHYLKKTYKKTASLIANSCKAVALLSDGPTSLADVAYHYGRHIGIAFQLIDDCLDFTADESHLGKPVTADLKLGLATAPVLYASEQFPELDELIARRFGRCGDVERAVRLVSKSRGVPKCRSLAAQHCEEAITHLLNSMEESAARNSLVKMAKNIVNRDK